jgi:hypothetical protein
LSFGPGVGSDLRAAAVYSAFISSQDANSQNLYLGVGYKF